MRRRRSTTWAGPALLAFDLIASIQLGAPRRAPADSGRTASLSWVDLPGAEGCGGAPAIARAVEERLGRNALVSPALADVSIEGRFERSGDPPRWRAVVQLRDSQGAVLGSRELASEAGDCSPLRDSAALAVALMVDPDATLRPEPTPVLPPPRVVVERVESTPSPSPSPVAWRIQPAASVALGFGVLPHVATGVLVDAAVAPPGFWSLDVFGRAWLPQQESVENRASVRFASVSGGLALCPVHAQGGRRVTFGLCAGGELGAIRTTSDGFPVVRPQTVTTLHVIAGGDLTVSVAPPLSLRVGGQLRAALLGARFVYEDAGGTQHDVFDLPLVTATADVGFAVAVP